MLSLIFWIITRSTLFFVVIVFILIIPASFQKLLRKLLGKKLSVAFFHPQCKDGGGGEKVLWQMVKALDESRPDLSLCVYSSAEGDVLLSVQQRFGLTFKRRIKLIPIRLYWLVDPNYWPIATLLGTSAASTIVAFEACVRHCPDVMIDTVGHAFIYPIFRFLTYCRIGCYVHYPTISTDMIRPIRNRQVAVNNSDRIVSSQTLSQMKLFYYQLFSLGYRTCGLFCDLVMVNSSWTKGHIDDIWKIRSVLLYPPCDVQKILDQKREESEQFFVVSVAQFRPEKRLDFQIEILQRIKEKAPLILDANRFKWRFVGSCRNMEDVKRVKKLKQLTEQYGLSDYVEFHVNVTYEQLMEILSTGVVAIHTMIEEHFGIAVVECMAAGLITIAHGTGGPKMDILCQPNCGFTAISLEEYADAIIEVFQMSEADRDQIRKNAQTYVLRFDTNKFTDSFLVASRPLFT